MGEEFNFDNILSNDEIELLFDDNSDNQTTNSSQDVQPEEQNEQNETEEIDTTEIDANELFEQSESVSSEKDTQDVEGTSSKKDSASPNNFYSSLLNALKEEGVFQNLDDAEVNDAESFVKAMNQEIESRFDEKQKRINEALEYGVQPSIVKQYENTLDFLDSINTDRLSEESEEGENLRKQLIYQDFINRGYSKERATREVKKSFDAGTDLEDAKESLTSNKEFFKEGYNKIIAEAKAEEEKFKEERNKESENLKKSILNDKEFFGDLQLDNNTRKKIYENITKPVYKDPKSGEALTAIQKYEKENRIDFLKNVSLIFTLTDGFKNLDGLVKNKVNKKVKEGLRNLESTLYGTATNSDGSLRFVTGTSIGSNSSKFNNGWDIDI